MLLETIELDCLSSAVGFLMCGVVDLAVSGARMYRNTLCLVLVKNGSGWALERPYIVSKDHAHFLPGLLLLMLPIVDLL